MVSAPWWNLFGIFLLQEHFVRSEVADATGIVKYTHKRVFRHQPPKTFWGGGGGYGPPASLGSFHGNVKLDIGF